MKQCIVGSSRYLLLASSILINRLRLSVKEIQFPAIYITSRSHFRSPVYIMAPDNLISQSTDNNLIVFYIVPSELCFLVYDIIAPGSIVCIWAKIISSLRAWVKRPMYWSELCFLLVEWDNNHVSGKIRCLTRFFWLAYVQLKGHSYILVQYPCHWYIHTCVNYWCT